MHASGRTGAMRLWRQASYSLKNTPAVYGALTQDEKDRMDWLMKALAISGNWGFNDQNNYKTGFDLLGNFNKEWNPNYRNTYLNVVISAAMYFRRRRGSIKYSLHSAMTNI